MNRFVKYLQCPDCGGEVTVSDQHVSCCRCTFGRNIVDGQLNLLPRKNRSCKISFFRQGPQDIQDLLLSINTDPPKNIYKGPSARRDSSSLFSVLSQKLHENALLLDLGCGPGDQAIPANFFRYNYVGLDCSGESADLLADAHSIPFKNGTFDGIISFAVLEHLHNPFVVIQEVERILRPGGVFVGAVSQGEPFHNSFFHHTALGLISLVSSTSVLKIERLWSSLDTLESLVRMGRYPRVVRLLLKAVHVLHQRLPFLAPRKMKWSQHDKNIDSLFRAGSICFLIKKVSKQ